jgi:rhodanese-related sulfurtransferase
MVDDEPEPVVPEVSAPDLLAEIQAGKSPVILDIRESYEWNQVRVPGVQHIPMNSIPQRLDELDRDADWVIMCAHGNRSYGVTAWLNDQGFTARNLQGGITMWNIRGGEVEMGKPA